ncbi:hypothetical protein D3C80_967440 [compost metagenome]
MVFSLEIRGRCDHCKTEIPGKRQGNHIHIDLFAQPNASIITFSDNIFKSVLADNFNVDIGILKHHRGEFRPENCIGCMFNGSNTHSTGWFFSQSAQRSYLTFNFVKMGSYTGK